ncbi:cyclic nucleotide-binding domain-containing protein [Paraliomyxa miuraensis]|uniref:cyclic nucleotide-binding domain-containing protein n=1 Tax=Paraliomyxa miuraensis TaxID=376150 RepID=UPI00225C02B6|nr:cyclic nucleotide-binding domain-containing protein [Paraliomyxa miuraensis]MCX4247120.1 cyclic nucleotide-binding domain-containing protein [Paraliomyxa miuraensis]
MLGRERPSLQALLERPASELVAEGWEWCELKAGEVLWRQGDETNGLAWVVHGYAQIRVDGVERDRVGPGGLLGEASVFVPGQDRTADVVAAEPMLLWFLRRDMLVRLQALHPELYDALIEAAIVVLARRIGANERALRRHQRGDRPPPRREPASWWTRMARKLEGRHPPPIEEAIDALPTFGRTNRLVTKLSELAEPLYVRVGEALCIEGDRAASMYIVARGELAVMLVAGDGAFEIGKVGPGALLGTSALFEEGTRTASLVAAEPTWVYELTRERLAEAPADVWRAMAKSLMVVLRGQLVEGHHRAPTDAEP